jgi:hypothetical protein
MPGGFDFSGLDDLAASLERVPGSLGESVHAGVKATAEDVKAAWAGKLAGSRGLARAGKSISYLILRRAGNEISAEVKPRLGGQGSLVWVPEFGSLSTAPRNYGRNSTQENTDAFVERISQAAADAERQAGL